MCSRSCGDYSRYFLGLGPSDADGFAHGLLALEQNWRGPLLTNGSVDTTLQQFRALERSAPPEVLANWRFQQALYRAYYDAYVRSRLIFETDLEEQALARLRIARELGSQLAMDQAEAILDRAVPQPVAADLRRRVFELAEALFQSIRMQLSVPRYKAISVGRGATLDTIDVPLNNRIWLERRFDAIRKLESEEARLSGDRRDRQLDQPGPGRFLRRPRRPAPPASPGRWARPTTKTPPRLHGPLTGFDQKPTWRRSWCRHAALVLRRAAADALHRARPDRVLQAPRRLHRRHVPGQSCASWPTTRSRYTPSCSSRET